MFYVPRRDRLQAGTIDIWSPYCKQNAPDAKVCKNLFLKDKKKKLVLCTALTETDLDMKILRQCY